MHNFSKFGEAAVVVLSHQTAALDELQIDSTVYGTYAMSSSIFLKSKS